ncbi:MAG: DNA topoisomerase I [candidate division Zixibacteria bacterium SM23_73_2]|nr:MAG: DNA topoisomerase I [candidate division Zixibacteria bacterium SM23_73_2]
MAENLIIVESPAKTRTIKKFLGKGWQVEATKGHIKDLPQRKLGVEIDKGFLPQYVVIKGKKRIIMKLKAEAKKASKVFLAPDPDREGEAIAWHVAQEIDGINSSVLRASFNEITKEAVLRGIDSAGPLDMKKVFAQQARRILDRLVGYKVSPFLWKTIYRGLSAGRVQSVALRILSEREKEIEEFISQEYWSITAFLETEKKKSFHARLFKIDGKDFSIENEKEAQGLVNDIQTKEFVVSQLKKEKKQRHPYPPYITSTLQQDSARRIFFSPKKTMTVAQQLYEGVDLGEKGSVGLITYMRTDSVRVSEEAKKNLRNYIGKNFGDRYLSEKPREYRSKKGAQEAHEAVRPTFVEYTPDEIKGYLTNDQFKLYQLIWNRFCASQMSSAWYDFVSAEIGADRYLFKASSKNLIFDGFLKVYKEIKENNSSEEEEEKIPELKEGELLNLLDLQPKQHFTKPPPRFNEASLIKELEANGIGRPSTYAQILSTLKQRKYVASENKKLIPTELGLTVNRILVERFPDIFNVEFTAVMESELDKIEEGEDKWIEVLKNFYTPFEATLKKVEKEKTKIKNGLEEKTDVLCEKCGKPMIVKWGKNGKFLACSGFPECKNTKPLISEEEEKIAESHKCELCGSPMVVKTGKFGRFLACSRYPDCKNTKPLSLGIKCPEKDCGGHIVERKSKRGKVFFGCSNYPECNFATWYKPLARVCPGCGVEFMVLKKSKSKGDILKCLKCGYEEKEKTEEKDE